LRLLDIKIHRAQVRRWAMENGLAQSNPPRQAQVPVRRWQRAAIGEWWQLDAAPLVCRLQASVAHAEDARRSQPALHGFQDL